MRSDSNSSQLSSAPSVEFLNRYSTSSIAEDKAEVWACLMCYQQVLAFLHPASWRCHLPISPPVWQVLASPALQAKAEILKARARRLCPAMDEAWWSVVVHAQQKHVDGGRFHLGRRALSSLHTATSTYDGGHFS